MSAFLFWSLPGLTRQSIHFAKTMDARVKPAHDSDYPAFNAFSRWMISVASRR